MMLLARTMMLLASSGTWAATLHVEAGGTVNVVNGGTLNIGSVASSLNNGAAAAEAAAASTSEGEGASHNSGDDTSTPTSTPPPSALPSPPPSPPPPSPPPPAYAPAATFTFKSGVDSTTQTGSGYKDYGKQCGGAYTSYWQVCTASDCTFDKCKELCIAKESCKGITWGNPASNSHDGTPSNYCALCTSGCTVCALSSSSKQGPWGVWSITRG